MGGSSEYGSQGYSLTQGGYSQMGESEPMMQESGPMEGFSQGGYSQRDESEPMMQESGPMEGFSQGGYSQMGGYSQGGPQGFSQEGGSEGFSGMQGNSAIGSAMSAVNSDLQADGLTLQGEVSELQQSGTAINPQNIATQIETDTASDSNASQVTTDLNQLANDQAVSPFSRVDSTDSQDLSNQLTTDGINLQSLQPQMQTAIQTAIQGVIDGAVSQNTSATNGSTIDTDLSNIFAAQQNQQSSGFAGIF